jgi:hypothetical protein
MSTDTTFRLELDGGFMQYNHFKDRWSLWSEQKGRVGDIGASHFKTIKEFKQWGQEKIDELL